MTTTIAPARLVRARDVWIWRVERCPLCRGTHQHGGGRVATADPRGHLGHRTADCAAGGYVLTDADPDRTHALVAERAVRS